MHRFDLFFSGKILEGLDLAQVQAAMTSQLRIPQTQVARMFSGRRVRIKSAVDAETAGKYRKLFHQVGALIEVAPAHADHPPADAKVADAAAPPPPPPMPATKAESDGGTSADWELLPPRTGSMIGLARTPQPVEIPSLDHIMLAPAGALLPEAAPGPRPDVDLASMSLAEPGATLAQLRDDPDTYAQVPDVSHMGAPQEIGSLEEFVAPKTPAPIPATDHLQLAPQKSPAAGGEPRPNGGRSLFEID
jgi:hypothetical protein